MAEVSRPLRSQNHLCGDQTLELNTLQPIIVPMNSFYMTSCVLKRFYCVFSMDHKHTETLVSHSHPLVSKLLGCYGGICKLLVL